MSQRRAFRRAVRIAAQDVMATMSDPPMSVDASGRRLPLAAHLVLWGGAFALVTIVGVRSQIDATTAALLDLLVVVLVSLWAPTFVAVTVAMAAMLSLDYFFTPPLYRIRIEQTVDVVAVVVFATAAAIITRLRTVTRRSFQEIQSLKNELELVIDTIPAMIWRARADGSADFVSRRWIEYTGVERADWLGSDWTRVLHPDDRAAYLAHWESVIATGDPLSIETRLRRVDGRYEWFLLQAAPLRDRTGQVVQWNGTATAIEDRKRAEAVVADHARLLDLTHDTIFVREADTNIITFWNRGAEELYGWSRAEAAGRTTHDLLRTVFPVPLEDITEQVFRTGRWEGELVHMSRSDAAIVVASRWSLQRNEAGRPLKILETNNDITGRRHAEDAARKAQAELAHAARVATMGELAASIAHEVNQPLSGVVINANACLRWLALQSPNLDEARDALQRIIRDGKRASDVVARVRALSRKSTAEWEPLDLNEAIRAVITVTQGELSRQRIVVKSQFDDDLPAVRGDRVQLQQVVLNLLVNGIDAMSAVSDRPRELVIRTRRDNGHVRVTVQDSGSGVDPQAMARLFDSFYTTKHNGLGMGLSISRSIVENHGGAVWAEPNDGPGTTFHFTV